MVANNHVMDWGRDGLADTLATLQRACVRTAGAGPDADAAWAPAIRRTIRCRPRSIAVA